MEMKTTKMEFESTNLPHNIAEGLYHEKGYVVDDIHIKKVFHTLFYGTAEILKNNKSKEDPVTFIVTNIQGKPIALATVEYFANEDETKPGNWSLVWSFDVDDIKENAIKIALQDKNTYSFFRVVAGEKWHMTFVDEACEVCMFTYCIEQLYKWLDENAKENEIVEIELDGVFNASVQVVDGKKEFAIVPSGEVKTIIKDDASIEK